MIYAHHLTIDSDKDVLRLNVSPSDVLRVKVREPTTCLPYQASSHDRVRLGP